ncbi:hypothetical protein PENARI_c046G06755 [Penicillium arizonense]|uniref:Uncharacterized protein n=1 Tax=Penicillium arizonense TaxID=1835702 RepID=A0A1F5L2X1_PENAI|nr:hypothetical protein PENARI_c046G06755 [Penicillium arizonense]OGE47396.1 hypothetical protein PENARI_c046G06755 [Penicillium arizonense]
MYLELLTLFSSFAVGKLIDVPDSTKEPEEVNYVAHAATIVPFPGQPTLLAFLDFLTAVFLPYSGLWRGASLIWRSLLFSGTRWNRVWNQPGVRAKWKEFTRRNPLEDAARAGALAVIVRSYVKWFPRPNEVVKCSTASLTRIHNPQQRHGSGVGEELPMTQGSTVSNGGSSTTLTTQSRGSSCNRGLGTPILPKEMIESPIVDPGFGEMRKVHGLVHLPNEYTVAILPFDAKVEFNGTGDQYRSYFAASQAPIPRTYQRSILSSNYNVPRTLIAIVQVFFAIYSLTTPSNMAQIRKYGFASFSLTVLPYLVMSLTNLFASLITPSYPALYLVRSEEMDEAERRGARFDGVIGSLDQSVTSDDVFTATYTNSGVKFDLPGGNAIDESGGAEYEFRPFSCSPFETSDDREPVNKHQVLFGALTGFKGKESSTLDQISMMLWFGFDCIYGLGVPKLRQLLLRRFLKMSNPGSLPFDRDSDFDRDPDFHGRYKKSANWYAVFAFIIVFVFCGPSSPADWLGVSWRQAHSEAHETLSGIDRFRCVRRPAGHEYARAQPAARGSRKLADLCFK